MYVKITKHADGYTAIVTSLTGETRWSSPQPMDEQSLRKSLQELGCDHRDVIHALVDADPRIALALRQSLVSALSDEYGPDRAKELLEEVDEEFRRASDASEINEER